MPKVSYSNKKGLTQETGSGFLPLGEAAGEVLGLGQIRTQTFTVDMTKFKGQAVNFLDNDVLVELGTLDVSTSEDVTATHIVLDTAIVNVTEAAGTALVARLDLSSTSGTAQNAEITNNTEMVGAGATYRNGQEIAVGNEADIDLNGAAVNIFSPNSDAAIAKKHLYLVTTTALAADVAEGSANIVVKYFVV